jgi:predicted ester cyclase
MSAESNKDLFRTYVGLWETGRIDDLPTVIHDHYVGHAPAGDRDLEGLRQRIAVFGQRYPGARFQIEDQLALGSKVATRLTATARRAADGQDVKLFGLNISRVLDGKIVEEWMAWEVQPVGAGKPESS